MAFPSPLVLGIFGLGVPELLIILVILMLLFGGAKLPALAKGLGQSIKEFKKAAKEDDDKPAASDKKSSGNASDPTNN